MDGSINNSTVGCGSCASALFPLLESEEVIFETSVVWKKVSSSECEVADIALGVKMIIEYLQQCTKKSVVDVYISVTVNQQLMQLIQVAQLSQRDRTAGWVSNGQTWKTGTERNIYGQYRSIFNHCVVFGQQRNRRTDRQTDRQNSHR